MLKKLLVIAFIIISLGQITFGQKAVSPAKKKLATQLAANTGDMFPIQVFDETLKSSLDKALSEKEKEFSDYLTESIDTSKWSDEKKSEVKAKIPAFIDRMLGLSRDLMSKDFNVKNWTSKSLEKNCQNNFTVAELQKLNKFFITADGKDFVSAFNRVTSAGINGGEKESFSADEEKRFEKIVAVVGERTMNKFFDIVVKNVMDDIVKSVEVWGRNMLKALEKEVKTGVIKKELEKFVADNI
jgi:hypothetical protein